MIVFVSSFRFLTLGILLCVSVYSTTHPALGSTNCKKLNTILKKTAQYKKWGLVISKPKQEFARLSTQEKLDHLSEAILIAAVKDLWPLKATHYFETHNRIHISSFETDSLLSLVSEIEWQSLSREEGRRWFLSLAQKLKSLLSTVSHDSSRIETNMIDLHVAVTVAAVRWLGFVIDAGEHGIGAPVREASGTYAKWSKGASDGWMTSAWDVLAFAAHIDSTQTSKLKVVDVGSGSGFFLLFLKSLLPDVIEGTGYEIVPSRVKYAQDMNQKLNSGLRFYQQDLSQKDLLLEQADVYYFYDSLNSDVFTNVIRSIHQVVPASDRKNVQIVIREGSGAVLNDAFYNSLLTEPTQLPSPWFWDGVTVFKLSP